MISGDILIKIRALLDNYKNIDYLNQFLKQRTGILEFFPSTQETEEFKQCVNNLHLINEKAEDLGDFQTPTHLTDRICKYLRDNGTVPDTIIEPTCGLGTFILSSLKIFPSLKYVYCVEIQKEYEWFFKLYLLQQSFEQKVNVDIEFHRDNIFTHRFSNKFTQFLNGFSKNILILGNPPWVTNTELSVLNSDNVPYKSNIKRDRGIEAITGKGNFDIAEYIIIQMIQQFSNRPGKIAMLCKTSVMKNIIRDIRKTNLKLSNIKSVLIDTKKEFNINAKGGLFLADFGTHAENFCTISSLYEKNYPSKKFGWRNDKFVSNIDLYENYKYMDGKSPFVWRQGVKHDAAKVMVLSIKNNNMLNGLQEEVRVEEALLFPFIKSSDLKTPVIRSSDRKIIITQTSLKEETEYIADKYPKLWKYLISHSKHLDNRKSVIYKKRPRFSIFGIGDYAFKPYKVAISGFYKKSNFSLIFPINNKPAMLDDTCYYLFFDNFKDAFITWIILNMDFTKEFLSALVFLDSKRPYTKDILMRIQIFKIAESLTYETLNNFYQEHLAGYLEHNFNETDFISYLH